MTTDITELAQRARINAECGEQLSPAETIELVEALEKAQKSKEFLKGQLSELANFNPDWDKLEASYESWREIAAELLVAKDRIAELESRTVTLKLPPKIERDDADGWFTYKGGRVGGGAAEWYNKALDDVSSAQPTVFTVKLPPLNDDLIAILGRPNFMCAHLAELLRKSGKDINRKAEHEQAAIIHWFLSIYLEHGEKWEGVAKSDIQARVAGIKWEAE